MSRTARFRRLASVVCLLAGPLLLLAASIVLPWYGDADTAETLQITSENMTATQWGDMLALIGLLAIIPAVLAVMRTLRGRAPVLGLLGGSLAVAGAACAMLWVTSDQFNLGVAGTPALRDQVAAGWDDSAAWGLFVVLGIFLVGIVIGTIVLGVGLLRSRVVPAWAGVALIVSGALGPVAHMADLKALDLISTALLVAGFAAVARLVLSVPDRDWDGGEIGQPSSATGSSAWRAQSTATP